MHYYASNGLVIEITPENIREFNLGQIGEDLIEHIEKEGLKDLYSDFENCYNFSDPPAIPIFDFEQFFGAFYDKYKISIEIFQVGSEADGCDENIKPDGFYFSFSEEDKYIKTIRPEWKNLPIEPQEAKWTEWC